MPDLPENVVPVYADLLDSSRYEPVLKTVDTVIHLAAQTGKARPREYFRTNAEGTRTLLGACERAGVNHFLFVSSIAAKFKKIRGYHYAKSKRIAEEAVRASGMGYTILRPTMILGEGSPIGDAFARFARMPVVPLFNGGKARVQPVDVGDVARAISAILLEGRFEGRTYELGGADVVTIKELLTRIRESGHPAESKPFRTLSFPAGITAAVLGLVEPLFLKFLPITVGQLATFRNDGLAEAHPDMDAIMPRTSSLGEMLQSEASPGEAAADEADPALRRECEVFCRYLINLKPDDYVLKKYGDCHRRIDLASGDRFDAFLLKLGSRGVKWCKCCDAYSRFFRPRSPLRKRLIYLLAILETSPRVHTRVDMADDQNRWLVFMRVAFRGGVFVLALLGSSVFLLPAQMLMGGRDKRAGDGEANDG
jgi:uncharacterized protein YbjT (DUF2867 family)